MFGYVMPCRHAMDEAVFDEYRSFYCGLCKQLKNSYGAVSRLLLNYDLVLLAILTDALSGEKGTVVNESCLANPFLKRKTLYSTKGLELAADALVVLSYHKFKDNISDERFSKKVACMLAMPFLNRIYKKARKKNPVMCSEIEVQIQKQYNVENMQSSNIDEACDATGKICEYLFSAASNKSSKILGRIGLFTGQIIYLLDAAEDFNDDIKYSSYNAFVNAGLSHEDAVFSAKRRCNMAAGEIALAYNLLEFKEHKNITDNIFFLGLPASIKHCGEKRIKKGKMHGQIDSLQDTEHK